MEANTAAEDNPNTLLKTSLPMPNGADGILSDMMTTITINTDATKPAVTT